ncbi:MAG: tetratricopeptide repeat protein [Balneolales bacterium]|nr:tetratricopeptide repeat protein [Balneolales bacterium]
MSIAFPLELPESLKSHLELFDKDPEKALSMLERHLKRRGNDAVGFFLLGWFHLKKGNREKAGLYAIKAKIFAPGSPFFAYLPYFFQHPDHFQAWIPQNAVNMSGNLNSVPGSALNVTHSNRFFVDLDQLITKLSKPETSRISLSEASKDLKHAPFRKGEGIATSTLAKIYEDQKQYKEAIKVYEKIAERNPERRDICESEISRLQSLIESR